MIRKIIIAILAALFLNEIIMLTFTEVQPNIDIVILGLCTAVFFLLRYLAMILIVEHIVEQHKNEMDRSN